MTALEEAQGRHYAYWDGPHKPLCRACAQRWPCDFQLQRDDAFRAWARVDELEAELGYRKAMESPEMPGPGYDAQTRRVR